MQPFFFEELQLRRAFAAGKYQAVASLEVRHRAHFHRLGTKFTQHRCVGLEITLHCQNPDLHLTCLSDPPLF